MAETKVQYSRLEHAKAYRAVHGGTLTDALRIISPKRETQPAASGSEHLKRARIHQEIHGGSLCLALMATALARPETPGGYFPGN